MKEQSIFDGVVRNEDSYTSLLKNLMLADSEYEIAILKLLEPSGFTLGRNQATIRTQVPLKLEIDDSDHGRADLLIETDEAMLLVEIKTSLYCDLTENQDFGLDEGGNPKLKGYVNYLRQMSRLGLSVGLCLLTPQSWIHRGTVQGHLDALPFPAKLVTWEQVCLRSLRSKVVGLGAFAHEFGKFLEESLVTVSFEEDENALLTSPQEGFTLVTASLKLHELVEQAIKELRVLLRTNNCTLKVADVWSDTREHGAVIYRDGREILWLGTWDKARYPLAVCSDDAWQVPEGLINFSELKPVEPPIKNWKAFQLPSRCFTGAEPLSHLVESLRKILNV